MQALARLELPSASFRLGESESVVETRTGHDIIIIIIIMHYNIVVNEREENK
jgi:hypothetical protein